MNRKIVSDPKQKRRKKKLTQNTRKRKEVGRRKLGRKQLTKKKIKALSKDQKKWIVTQPDE